MAAKQRFALFLESAGSGDAAAEAVRRHGAVAVAAARAEFSGRILVGVSTMPEIVALLGEPDSRAASAIAYLLPARAEYLADQRLGLRRGPGDRVPPRRRRMPPA